MVRLPIRVGPEGIAAGVIGAAPDVRQNTLSDTLSVLLQAGLVRRERHGRSIRSFADLEGQRGLLGFPLRDCCGARADLCPPLIDAIARVC